MKQYEKSKNIINVGQYAFMMLIANDMTMIVIMIIMMMRILTADPQLMSKIRKYIGAQNISLLEMVRYECLQFIGMFTYPQFFVVQNLCPFGGLTFSTLEKAMF